MYIPLAIAGESSYELLAIIMSRQQMEEVDIEANNYQRSCIRKSDHISGNIILPTMRRPTRAHAALFMGAGGVLSKGG
jgi:hypothetical protein